MSDEDKKEIAEEAGKRLIWDMLDASYELSNMSSYTRSIIRKNNDCSFLTLRPTKDLVVRYGINLNRGYAPVAWWLLEQWEKGNITIKEDALPE